MSLKKFRPCGDYRTSYSSDMSMFQDKGSYYLTLAGIVFLSMSPFVFDSYIISQVHSGGLAAYTVSPPLLSELKLLHKSTVQKFGSN